MPLVGKHHAVVLLDEPQRADAAGWIAPEAKVEGPSSEAAALLADETKLPEKLRLRGLAVHVYADGELLCDGTFGTARVGGVGNAAVYVHQFNLARNPKELLGPYEERVLLFEIDVAPACQARLDEAESLVAWARDASLPTPVLVGEPVPSEGAEAREDVRRALRLVRKTPAFVRAQQSADSERVAYGHPPMPLELQSREHWAAAPSWTRYSWDGDKRAYLSFIVDCPLPYVRVGFEFRETAEGTLELLPLRSALERDHHVGVGLEVVGPVALVDVDADGRLEVIESDTSYRLRSFDGTETHVQLPLDHCR